MKGQIDSPFKGSDTARVTGAIVTFESGARTAWHTYPLGQTLLVTAGCGCGRVQRDGGPIEEKAEELVIGRTCLSSPSGCTIVRGCGAIFFGE